MPGLISRLTGSLFLLFFSAFSVFGQAPLSKQNWYFGRSDYGLRFARPDFTVTLDSVNKTPPFSAFGNATANSPETGDLLFYTDGQYLYDANFQLMDGVIPPNPAFLLNADVNKNQNTAIVSTPGDDNRYIVFTNTAGDQINFSVVDMSLPGNSLFPQPNLGSVTLFNQTVPTSTASTSDAMLALANANLTGYWLITVDRGTNNYKVLSINGADPAAWTEQQFNVGNILDAAHFAYSPVNGKIAVAPSSSNTNIQILDFDNATGTLALDTVVLNSGNADQPTEAIYDVEWSPDGTKLYVSRYGGSPNVGDLLQWDSTLPSTSSLVSILPNQVYGSYGLQMGPDNIIYHLYQEINGGPYLLGGISDADSIPANVIYNPQVLGGQNFESQQFPAILPPRASPLTVDFNFAGTCANTPTTFYPILSPAPDSVFWDFGDGTGNSRDLSPFYTYTSASVYNVTLFAALNGQIQQTTKPVTITQFDLQLNLVADTVACSCELPVNGTPTPCTPFSVAVQANNEPPGTTYIWSNGDVGTVLTPDSAGYYYVIATDPISGCSAHAGVNVQEYGIPDQRANVWYFGQNAGIDFNEVPPAAIDDGIMDAPEGCTAISDRNGSILFYTDGDAVYIKDRISGVHSQVDIDIGGDPLSAQSVIATPFINDETLYYIFTTEAVGSATGNYEFKFSVFDIKLNGGQGGIAEKDITLFTKSTERIAINGNWVVIHEYGNNNFRAYPITATGLGNPVVSSMGSDHSTANAAFGQGYMKFSTIGNKLAVALAESPTGPNYIEVFEWDNTLGEVTDFRRIDLTGDGASGQVYGVEFAPGDVKLFATIQDGANSQIMEYRADSLDRIQFIPPIIQVGSVLGAIQNAPNGQTLVAVDGSSSLGAILVNGDTVGSSSYDPNGFTLLPGTSSRLGLPNFANSFGSGLQTPSYFVSSPVCAGQPITLIATTTSVIDTAYWQITSSVGNIVYTSQNLSDTTTLNVPGDYLVSLLIGNRCGYTEAFSQTVTVNPPPQASSLPPGLPICGASALLEVYDVDPPNIADLTFLWSTGETTEAITVTSLGQYDVVMTDTTTGCTSNASVFVGPPFTTDLGPDQAVCESDPLILDSQANANLYLWFIDGNPVVPANNQRTFDFGAQALPAGVYTVRVEVEDPVDPTCFVVDETIITVNATPAFTAVENNPVLTCGGADGEMIIDITSSGNFTYVISGPTPVLNSPLTGPGNVIVPGLAAGVYVVTITNNVSACTEQVSNVQIGEPVPFAITVNGTSPHGCDLPSGTIDFELDLPVASFNWQVRDQSGMIVGNGNASSTGAGDIITVGDFVDGTYSLEVTEAIPGGCTDSEIDIVIDPTPVTDLLVPLTIAECGTTLDFQAFATSAAGVVEWSEDNGTTFNPITQPFTSFGSFPVQFRATNQPITCDTLSTVNVTLVPTPTVDILVDTTNICNGSVLLTADGDGGYGGAPLSYRWSTGETTPSITVTASSTVNVTVVNDLNQSCFGQDSEVISLPTPFTVTLSSTLACDDGSPFTLTATATNAFVEYTWYLDGIELPDKTSQIQSVNAGLFEVEVTDEGAGRCTNTATLEVVKAPITPTDLSSAVVFCPDEGDIELDAGSNFINYLWSTGESTQSIMIAQGGVYSIEATNDFGCVTLDQSEVFEDCIPKVYGPTAFRPGGLNNEFYLFTEYVDEFEIFIYNRWGILVFYANDINFRWDGTFNGELQPAAQYSYVVRYTSSFRDRGTLEQYGGVTLLR